MTFVFKSYEILLIRVFLHAEFISAPKTEINLWFLRNIQKMEKNIIYYHYFLFFVIFV